MRKDLGYNGSDKMVEKIKIKEEINEKIKQKIKNSNYPEEIKEFLNKVLLLEFDHIDEARPRITDDYENYIRMYVKKWKSEQT